MDKYSTFESTFSVDRILIHPKKLPKVIFKRTNKSFRLPRKRKKQRKKELLNKWLEEHGVFSHTVNFTWRKETPKEHIVN